MENNILDKITKAALEVRDLSSTWEIEDKRNIILLCNLVTYNIIESEINKLLPDSLECIQDKNEGRLKNIEIDVNGIHFNVIVSESILKDDIKDSWLILDGTQIAKDNIEIKY